MKTIKSENKKSDLLQHSINSLSKKQRGELFSYVSTCAIIKAVKNDKNVIYINGTDEADSVILKNSFSDIEVNIGYSIK